MSLKEWFILNKRVTKLEQHIMNLRKENLALISTPFLEPEVDSFDGEIVRGSEIEENEALLEEESVEEREYREEQNWLRQRKQKEKMV